MASARQTAFPFAMLRASAEREQELRAGGAREQEQNVEPSAQATQPLRQSAVRVPHSWDQSEIVYPATGPRLFVHEGARQALEKKLESLLGQPVHVAITDNRRTMISTSRKNGLLVRVHHMFLDADPFTERALAKYVQRPSDRGASDVLGAFIEAHRQKIAVVPDREITVSTRGEQYDLIELFDELNRTYFHGLVDAQITWGRAPQRSRRRARRRVSIKLGSYCPDQKLIRIHPALDRDYVPRYFIAYVIFHEMLHHVVPMPVQGGRRIFHSREFNARERAFPDYDRALAWEKRNVGRLMKKR